MPPSVILVIYAILAEQNIEKLFVAALVPGILAAIGYMIAVRLYVALNPGEAGTRDPIPMRQRFVQLGAVWPVLIVFLAVVGGIYGGIFTPTEAAAVGALGTGLIALINGGLTGKTLIESFLVTAKSTAMIFFIVLGAAFYNGFLALTQVPQEMADWVVAQGYAPIMVLVVILVFYLVFGCLMDSLSMILLTIPIFFPVVSALDFGMVDLIAMQHEAARAALASGIEIAGEARAQIEALIAAGAEIPRELQQAIDIRVTQGMADRIAAERTAIWFGILVLIVVEVGLITPPVGMNLFVLNAMDRATPIVRTYRAVIYFVGTDIVRVAILVAFPAITLFLI
jgi:TRAP-type C4-dicarboxylate transport system permease large subunit